MAAVLPPSELGTVFSLIETISATFPIILAPLASATYTAELEKEMAANLFVLLARYSAFFSSDFLKVTAAFENWLFS